MDRASLGPRGVPRRRQPRMQPPAEGAIADDRSGERAGQEKREGCEGRRVAAGAGA